MNKILIVEDEVKVALLYKKGLQNEGFSVTAVFDGEQALQAIQTSVYNLILLDLGLPVKDGWAVLKELRRLGNECPVILITAYDITRREALAAGASDFLSKPFKIKALLSVVQRQLNPMPP